MFNSYTISYVEGLLVYQVKNYGASIIIAYIYGIYIVYYSIYIYIYGIIIADIYIYILL